MNVRTEVFVTLRRELPGCNPDSGIEAEAPEWIRMGDLLVQLDLSGSKVVVPFMVA